MKTIKTTNTNIAKINGMSTVKDRKLAGILGISNRKLRGIVKSHSIRFTDEFVIRENNALHFTMKDICLLSFYIDRVEAIEIGVQIISTFTEVQRIFNKPQRLRLAIEHTEQNGNMSCIKLYDTIKQMVSEMYVEEAE